MGSRKPHFKIESAQASLGRFSFGLDEVGRGCLAGPVVACAAYIEYETLISLKKKRDPHFKQINDSKKVKPELREAIYNWAIAHPGIDYAVARIEAPEIDTINILQASLKAMEIAAEGLMAKLRLRHPSFTTPYALIDGNQVPKGLRDFAEAIVKGDGISVSIALSSIIAKTVRDQWMKEVAHLRYPRYGFSAHVGYGTAQHRLAIRQFGYCPEHRKSFAPYRNDHAACLE